MLAGVHFFFAGIWECGFLAVIFEGLEVNDFTNRGGVVGCILTVGEDGTGRKKDNFCAECSPFDFKDSFSHCNSPAFSKLGSYFNR